MRLSEYLNKQLAYGEYTFTLNTVEAELRQYDQQQTRSSIIKSISRLVAKGEIASPAKGFYVIIPPEDHIFGCLHPEDFIDNLMQYWQKLYYVGLLSAAQYHGASHQKPQSFQVVSNIKKKAIRCGAFRIQFIYKKNIAGIPTEVFSRTKSTFNISTPEVTALDLIKYPLHSGGFSNIATVLSELNEKIDANKMLALIKTENYKPLIQRLGYLFEIIRAKELTQLLKHYLSKQKKLSYVLLAPYNKKVKNVKKNIMWKLIINTKIESDV